MNMHAPQLPQVRSRATASASLIFLGFIITLPLAIFTAELPDRRQPPPLIEPGQIHPPKDYHLPPVPSTDEVDIPDAPLLDAPERPAPDLKPIEITPERIRISDTTSDSSGFRYYLTDGDLLSGIELLDHPPEVLHSVAPRPPFRPGRMISVTLELIVETDGRVSAVEVIAADHLDFAQAAVAAASRWRFSPGMRDERPVRFRIRQRFDFRP